MTMIIRLSLVLGTLLASNALLATQAQAQPTEVSKVKVTQASEWSDGLFEGDIVPTWESIAPFYGVEFANRLVEMGLMEKPINSNSDEIQVDGGMPELRWEIQRDPLDGSIKFPFRFAPNIFNETEKETIVNAINDLSKLTNGLITFVSGTGDEDQSLLYKNGTSDSDCSSFVGKRGGGKDQTLQLKGCFVRRPSPRGAIIHEHIHALGFHHEQR